MRSEPGITSIHNGRLVDGTGGEPVSDAVVVIDNARITYAGPAAGSPPVPNDARQIDANGGTIMPGLIEAHFHASYYNVLVLEDLDIKYPPEMVSMQSTFNARMALECGYTSALSAGCCSTLTCGPPRRSNPTSWSGPASCPAVRRSAAPEA